MFRALEITGVNIEDKTEAGSICHVAKTWIDAKTDVIAYIKLIEMRIDGSVYNVEPPEKNKEEYGIIYILSVQIPVGPNC